MNRDHYLSKRRTSLPPPDQQAASKGKTDVGSELVRPIEPVDNMPTKAASGAKLKTKNKN